MLEEDKSFREAKAMTARLVDNWHDRNRRAIVGGGLAHAVRIDLMNELMRTLAPLCRRAAGPEAAEARPEALPEPKAPKAVPKARKITPADAAKLLPFRGKLMLPGETEGIVHPPAPRGGRKRKGAPLPATEGPPDAA